MPNPAKQTLTDDDLVTRQRSARTGRGAAALDRVLRRERERRAEVVLDLPRRVILDDLDYAAE